MYNPSMADLMALYRRGRNETEKEWLERLEEIRQQWSLGEVELPWKAKHQPTSEGRRRK